MSMRKQIELEWNGKKYSILVTMEVIERLEEHVNLATMVARCSTGDIRFSHAASLIAALLREGGAKVSADDVYSEMFGGGDVSPAEVGKMLGAIFGVIFPEPKKKAPLPATAPAPAKPSKAATGTRGKKRTK